MKIYKILFLLLVVACFGCEENLEHKESSAEISYFCGAEEQISSAEGNLVFQGENMQFAGGEQQSTKVAFEGDKSIQLDTNNRYGFTFIITDIEKDEYIKAKVLQMQSKEVGAVVCVVNGHTSYNLSSIENPVIQERDGWMLHQLNFRATQDLDSLTFFVFYGGDSVAFFDNFQVERFVKRPIGSKEDWNSIALYIPQDEKNILDNYINGAIGREILRDAEKEYVKGFILDKKDSIPIKIRLKGDWTDHLRSGSPSFRIKTKSNFAFEDLRSFSIQHPRTRNFMHEWFLHQLCDQENLLSTTYDFLGATINDQFMGVYALEEHFDKQLLESRNRREGPILKIDESGFWAAAILERKLNRNDLDYPYYLAAQIDCFKTNRTKSTPSLSAQFENAAILLEKFKNGDSQPEDIFDMQDLGRYMALMDLGNVHHALAWHNRRFYYNPVTTKLEHIGFDMSPMVMPFNSLVMFDVLGGYEQELKLEQALNRPLLFNEAFRLSYLKALEKYSSVVYLDSVFEELSSEIQLKTEMMTVELDNYSFEKHFYYEKAEMIRNQLPLLEKQWNYFLTIHKADNMMASTNYKNQASPYLKEISVNAYTNQLENGIFEIEVDNFVTEDIALVAYSSENDKKEIQYFESPTVLKRFDGETVQNAKIEVKEKPAKIYYFTGNNRTDLKKKKVSNWGKPNGQHPRIKLRKAFRKDLNIYAIAGNVLTIKKGNYEVDHLIYIPSNYNVIIESGVTIDFVKSGGLIINNAVEMKGTKESPIIFNSSDKTGMGVTILKAGMVNVSYVEMYDMSCLDYEGWKLTGAFTIYEAKVKIDHLIIKNNTCEDGLNLIRSEMDIKNLHIEGTYSDGFDADFCTGTFSNSVFKNTGNDCIDFSGSQVTISNITINNSGDKGISAGERSNLDVKDINIDGALTGIASKDNSNVIAQNVTVKNAKVGVAAFKKKPEYGPSQITLSNCSYENLERLGLIELGSVVYMNDQVHYGYRVFDIDKMYAQFEKK